MKIDYIGLSSLIGAVGGGTLTTIIEKIDNRILNCLFILFGILAFYGCCRIFCKELFSHLGENNKNLLKRVGKLENADLKFNDKLDKYMNKTDCHLEKLDGKMDVLIDLCKEKK